jgi:hypothetical protein
MDVAVVQLGRIAAVVPHRAPGLAPVEVRRSVLPAASADPHTCPWLQGESRQDEGGSGFVPDPPMGYIDQLGPLVRQADILLRQAEVVIARRVELGTGFINDQRNSRCQARGGGQ